MKYLRNKHNKLDAHFHLHFIEVQCLDMFRALLAHLQEALHERRFGDCCVRLSMWVGLRIWELGCGMWEHSCLNDVQASNEDIESSVCPFSIRTDKNLVEIREIQGDGIRLITFLTFQAISRPA